MKKKLDVRYWIRSREHRVVLYRCFFLEVFLVFRCLASDCGSFFRVSARFYRRFGFRGLHRSVPPANQRPIRFYWVLPGFTGFYWVLLFWTLSKSIYFYVNFYLVFYSVLAILSFARFCWFISNFHRVELILISFDLVVLPLIASKAVSPNNTVYDLVILGLTSFRWISFLKI